MLVEIHPTPEYIPTPIKKQKEQKPDDFEFNKKWKTTKELLTEVQKSFKELEEYLHCPVHKVSPMPKPTSESSDEEETETSRSPANSRNYSPSESSDEETDSDEESDSTEDDRDS